MVPPSENSLASLEGGSTTALSGGEDSAALLYSSISDGFGTIAGVDGVGVGGIGIGGRQGGGYWGNGENRSPQGDLVTNSLSFLLVHLKFDGSAWAPLLSTVFVGSMALLHVSRWGGVW